MQSYNSSGKFPEIKIMPPLNGYNNHSTPLKTQSTDHPVGCRCGACQNGGTVPDYPVEWDAAEPRSTDNHSTPLKTTYRVSIPGERFCADLESEVAEAGLKSGKYQVEHWSNSDLGVVTYLKHVTASGGKYNARPNDKRLPAYDFLVNHNNTAFPTSGTFLSQGKALVTCDWLTLRLSDSLKNLTFPENGVLSFGEGMYRIELLPYGTTLFNKLGNVYHSDNVVAQIQFDARMPTQKDVMHIKYENWILYEFTYNVAPGAKCEIYSKMFDCLGCKFLGVTRLDIAIDGVYFDGFLTDLINGKYEQLKVQNVKPVEFDMKTQIFKGFYVGKRGGKKFGCYYDKSQEIADGENKKRYILDYWQHNGMDITKQIHRFEIRLTSDALKDMQDFEFTDCMFTRENLLSIFKFQIQNFFEFVETDSCDSRRSRRDRVPLFDFSKVETSDFIRVKKKLLNGLRTAKMLTKRLIKEAYFSEGDEGFAFLTSAKDMIEHYCLWEWELDKQHIFEGEIMKEALCKGKPLNPAFSGTDIYTNLKSNTLSYS